MATKTNIFDLHDQKLGQLEQNILRQWVRNSCRPPRNPTSDRSYASLHHSDGVHIGCCTCYNRKYGPPRRHTASTHIVVARHRNCRTVSSHGTVAHRRCSYGIISRRHVSHRRPASSHRRHTASRTLSSHGMTYSIVARHHVCHRCTVCIATHHA